MQEKWEATLECAPEMFFKSKEAMLEKSGKISKGKPAYQGLNLKNENNGDLKHMSEISWRSKADLGKPLGTYHKLRIVFGQYARFAIPAGICRAGNIWEQGRV